MNKPEKILDLRNEIEARLLESILKEKDIPYILRSYHDSILDGLWQTDTSWGALEAPVEFKEEILKIYEEILLSGNQPKDQ